MHDLVSALLELQELEIILKESDILHRGKKPKEFDALEVRVNKLRDSIPASELRRYDGLRRGGPGVVREKAGICTGCNLNVPIGDLNRMRRGNAEWFCPNCGRFLLLATG